MVKTTILAAFAAIFVGFAAPVWAEAPKIPAGQAALASPRPPMWVIRDEDSTLYVFGTIHAMREGVTWMTPAIQERFDQSTDLWLEIADMDDTAKLQAVAMKYMFDPAGKLTERLTADEASDLGRRLQACGASTQQLSIMRKWAVGLFLVQCQFKAMGLNPEHGIDLTLLREARAAAKTIHGLETIEEQMDILAPDTPDEDLKTLRMTLSEIDKTPEIIDPLISAWLAGDIEAMEKPLVTRIADEDRDGYERMIVQRNRSWVPRIKAILDGEGTVFIAVGTAHLIGDDSVIALLDQAGISAKPIKTGS
ncbi:TraB/GumN family protein [Asticcacaulis sp. AC402]|uniref:TraB/GumN family protein n=1 Tax=Asticcacaulis sp. AC402 TaxID=1282361 RepID=UPI0003C3F9C7|nr:TraB/GumN family protein [Asticcacaulis sp. AC402]ESQ77195.1 hypothetical protein ABAC402_01985 [Asticcacaulis sp. AC402]